MVSFICLLFIKVLIYSCISQPFIFNSDVTLERYGYNFTDFNFTTLYGS